MLSLKPHLMVEQPLAAGETVRLSTGRRELEARVRECRPSEGGYALLIEILEQGARFENHKLTAAFLGAAGVVMGLVFAVLLSLSSGTVGHAKELPAFTGEGQAEVPEPPPLPGQAVPHQLALRAAEPSWVTVCSDGKKVIERLFQQGDAAKVPYLDTATVRAGNAAGLEITLAGQTLSKMGPPGAIRMLRATGDGFEFVPPVASNACQTQ